MFGHLVFNDEQEIKFSGGKLSFTGWKLSKTSISEGKIGKVCLDQDHLFSSKGNNLWMFVIWAISWILFLMLILQRVLWMKTPAIACLCHLTVQKAHLQSFQQTVKWEFSNTASQVPYFIYIIDIQMSYEPIQESLICHTNWDQSYESKSNVSLLRNVLLCQTLLCLHHLYSCLFHCNIISCCCTTIFVSYSMIYSLQ